MTFVNATHLNQTANHLARKIEEIDNLAIKIWGLTLWGAAKIFGDAKEPEMKKLIEQQKRLESKLEEVNTCKPVFTDPFGLTIEEKRRRDDYIKTIDKKG